jgi:hypothetical protein
MIKLAAYLLFTMLFYGCVTTIKTFDTNDPDKIGVKANNFRGTIFKLTYPKAKLYIQPGDSLIRFTPDKNDIVLAETILKQQIDSINNPRVNQFGREEYIDENLSKYFRQYVGFINEQGHRVVHINFYWDRVSVIERAKGYRDGRLGYSSDFALVFDGGSRYWNINVDLTTKTLYALFVNGVA